MNHICSWGLAGEQGRPTVAHDLCSSTLRASACDGDPVIFSSSKEGKDPRGFLYVTLIAMKEGNYEVHFLCGATWSHLASSEGRPKLSG